MHCQVRHKENLFLLLSVYVLTDSMNILLIHEYQVQHSYYDHSL